MCVLALCAAERFILPFNLHSRLRYKHFHPHLTYVEAEARRLAHVYTAKQQQELEFKTEVC